MEAQAPAVHVGATHKGPKSSSPYFVGPAAPVAPAPMYCNAKKEEGQKFLATPTGRVPIQPSICGIPSGHLLSLRSPASLEKTREVLIEQQKHLWLERQQRPRQKQSFQQGQRSLHDAISFGGQSKYCRLQPLGVVDTEVMNPEEVLGVLPVRLQDSVAEDIRPKSCAASRMTSLSERNAAVIAKVKPRKRSYSAVLSHQLSGEELGEMLYVSRHMALVPQGEQDVDHGGIDLQSISRTLPSVIGSRALNSKPKMKSLRQGRQGKVKIVEPKDDETSPTDKLPPIGTDGAGEIINIQISTSTPSREDTKIDNADGKKPHKKVTMATESARSPRTLSPKIVSIGEASETEKAALKMRHHPSSGVKGRLSQGWSSPQPIKGVTGSPLHTSKGGRKEATKVKRGAENEAEAMLRSSTPGMMVDINISDFLGTDSDPDNIEQEKPSTQEQH